MHLLNNTVLIGIMWKCLYNTFRRYKEDEGLGCTLVIMNHRHLVSVAFFILALTRHHWYLYVYIQKTVITNVIYRGIAG